MCPLGGYRDELSYESFEPCPAVDSLDALGEDVEQVEVEVLEHGGCDEEHGVLVKERERQVRPSEVVVLAVEVALRCAALVVVGDDVALAVVPIVGDDAPVDVVRAEKLVLPIVGQGALHDEPQVQPGQHGVELERRHAAPLTADGHIFPTGVLHELGVARLAVAGADVEPLAVGRDSLYYLL